LLGNSEKHLLVLSRQSVRMSAYNSAESTKQFPITLSMVDQH